MWRILPDKRPGQLLRRRAYSVPSVVQIGDVPVVCICARNRYVPDLHSSLAEEVGGEVLTPFDAELSQYD